MKQAGENSNSLKWYFVIARKMKNCQDDSSGICFGIRSDLRRNI